MIKTILIFFLTLTLFAECAEGELTVYFILGNEVVEYCTKTGTMSTNPTSTDDGTPSSGGL